MRVLIYLRVSSKGQAQKATPLETQRLACLEHARNNKWKVDEATDIYIDKGISGKSTYKRDDFKAMMERLATDETIDGVLAYDISRIFRNGPEYIDFKRRLDKIGKKFFSVMESLNEDGSPSGFLLEWILAGIADFNSRHYGVKVREGLHRKAESGEFPGKAPFGYKNIQGKDYGGKEKRSIVTDPVTSVWVKKIFGWYASGQYSFQDMVDKLNSEGCPPPTKKHWCQSSLEKILKNKMYIGWIEYGGISNNNGKQDHLVDNDTFYEVQTVMEARNYSADKSWKHTFLLRGIAWCAECGSRIQASYHVKKKSGKTYAHYGCPSRQHGKKVECSQSVVAVDDLDGQLKAIIKTMQIPESNAEKLAVKIRKLTVQDLKSGEEMKKSITIQLGNIKSRGERILEEFLDGNIQKDVFHNYQNDLKERETRLMSELEKVEETTSKMAQEIEDAIALAKDCYRTFKRASFDQKVILVRALFEKVVVKDKRIIEAWVHHPYAYICKKKLDKNPVFLRMMSCGDGRSRTAV